MDYKTLTKQAYDEIADDYSKRDDQVIEETLDVQSVLGDFISLLPAQARVLDVGSGGGRDSMFLHNNGMRVTGIDISEAMVRNAKKKLPEAEFLVMDFENIDFPPETFDAVWANASLHHIPKQNIPPLLKTMYTILKPGGFVFIKVKHGSFDGIRENEKFGKKIQRHFAFYESEELRDLVSSAGFVIVDLHETTSGEWVDVVAKK